MKGRPAAALAGLLGFVVCLAPGSARAVDLGAPRAARWIWFPEGSPASAAPAATRYFRGWGTLPADAKVRRARLVVTADNGCVVHVNGKRVAVKRSAWSELGTYDVERMLVPGRNLIAVAAKNSGGPAGLVGWLDVRLGASSGGRRRRALVATDGTWKSAQAPEAGWERPGFDDSAWVAARVLGRIDMAPWGGQLAGAGYGLAIGPLRRGDGPVSAEAARELIEADWVHQADERTTPARSLEEVAWARALARRLAALGASTKSPDFETELTELAALESRLRRLQEDGPGEGRGGDFADDDGGEARELYLAVRRVKRRIAFRNPLVDFERIILVDSPGYAGVHESAHRNGHNYGNRAGARLLVMEGLRPDAAERVLVPSETGFIMRMDLSFDATKVVFGMKPAAERSFHLYEMGVDGEGLRQLTRSAYDDMDPIYLPDGRIMFSTSRGHTYVRCLPQSESTVLARCDADGRNIYIVSRNNEPDYTPALLPDGRVLYTRWEYTERPLWRLQKLWTINPDGTGEAVYWGNSSAHPDMLWEARPVPGTTGVMFAAVGHHNVHTGVLGTIDVSRGREYPHGITKVTPELRWPEVGDARDANAPPSSADYHRSGRYWSYRCPYPLGREDFLVAAARKANGRFDLYLMDVHGNRELIYAGKGNAWYARPLRPRARPPVIPDRVAWPGVGEEAAPGVLFSPNVYRGVAGLPRGKAKYLRVIQMDAKTYSTGYKSWRHSGPAISVIQEDGVKRILGTVPIRDDGSVAFKVPAGKALHFQLLDEHQRCIQIMRSFTGVMPGETRGCLGCHSLHSASPQSRERAPRMAALDRPPEALTPPPWGAEVSISYERFCQPILDKYCGKCHQGNGKGRAKLDLTLRGGVKERGIADPRLLPFKEPYLTLIGPAWSGPAPAGKGAGLGLAGCMNVERERRYRPLAPMTMLSSTSRLIKIAMSGKHNKVKIEGEDLLRLIAWVDLNCVYRGDEEVRMIPDPDATIASRFAVPPKIRTAPRVRRLHPVSDPLPRGNESSGPGAESQLKSAL